MKSGLALLSVLIAATVVALILIWGEPPRKLTPLEKASAFVKACSSERHIRKNEVFLNMEGEHTPSRWTEYFLSVYSTRNWVLEDSEEAKKVGKTLAGLISCSIKPKDVRFVLEDSPPPPAELSNPPQYELVVWADDQQGIIGVTGYEGENDNPVLEKQWAFSDFTKPKP
jgi:hypothetical protein